MFEYVERTILEDLEARPEGLSEERVRSLMWQLLKAVECCHAHNVIHRDIKPENLLIGGSDELRLCDFGFARPLGGQGARYSDYVATRWYRAPELLVGDTQYGKGVDIWAVGCILVEVRTGIPVFPGQDDVDQLWLIMRAIGSVCERHARIMRGNSSLSKLRHPRESELEPLTSRFPQLTHEVVSLLDETFRADPDARPSASDLLSHRYFEPETPDRRATSSSSSRSRRKRQPSRDEQVPLPSTSGSEDPSYTAPGAGAAPARPSSSVDAASSSNLPSLPQHQPQPSQPQKVSSQGSRGSLATPQLPQVHSRAHERERERERPQGQGEVQVLQLATDDPGPASSTSVSTRPAAQAGRHHQPTPTQSTLEPLNPGVEGPRHGGQHSHLEHTRSTQSRGQDPEGRGQPSRGHSLPGVELSLPVEHKRQQRRHPHPPYAGRAHQHHSRRH